MPDAVELIKTIKRVAVDAVNSEKPVQVCFGVVKSTDPLTIFVGSKNAFRSKPAYFNTQCY